MGYTRRVGFGKKSYVIYSDTPFVGAEQTDRSPSGKTRRLIQSFAGYRCGVCNGRSEDRETMISWGGDFYCPMDNSKYERNRSR